jgi:outer membrane protein assembly factor BamB
VTRPDDLVEVELVEDERRESAVPVPRVSWRSRAAAVPRRVWVTAAGLVVAGTTTVGVVGVVERAVVEARLAGTDGLSASLDRPLVEAWRTDGDHAIGYADGVVLVQGSPRLGGETVAAVDALTGDVRWTQPGQCQAALADPEPAAPFVDAWRVLRSDAGDVLMCRHDTVGPPSPDHPAATVTTHHPSTGALLHTITLDEVSTRTIATLGADLVSAGTEPDGRVRAGRWSLRTGERLWDYRSPDAPAADFPAGDGVGFSVAHDAVTVQAGSWEVRLDPATGAPLDDSDATAPAGARPFPWGPVPLPDGATATGSYDPDRSARITVEDADGTTRFSVEGFLLPAPAVDDGTASSIVLTMEPGTGAMIALDAGSGEERWRTPVQVGDRVVLSGLLIVTDGSRTTAVDTRTGDIRWESETTVTSNWTVVTDGRRVLTVDGSDTGAVLVARDVRTGEPAWTADSPVGSADLRRLPDGTVLATGTTGVVALRPPGP